MKYFKDLVDSRSKKVFRNNHDLPEGYEISYEQFHMTP